MANEMTQIGKVILPAVDDAQEAEGYQVCTCPPTGTAIDIPPGAVAQSNTITIAPTPVTPTATPLQGGGGASFATPRPTHYLPSVRAF